MTDTHDGCADCHGKLDGWQTLPIEVEALSDQSLAGRTMRLYAHAAGPDGRQHLVLMAQGAFEGGAINDDGSLSLALFPDPDGPVGNAGWARLCREALARRLASLDAGEPPSRELFGPLDGRHLLQVAL